MITFGLFLTELQIKENYYLLFDSAKVSIFFCSSKFFSLKIEKIVNFAKKVGFYTHIDILTKLCLELSVFFNFKATAV